MQRNRLDASVVNSPIDGLCGQYVGLGVIAALPPFILINIANQKWG